MRRTPVEGWIAERLGVSRLTRAALEAWQLQKLNETLGRMKPRPFYKDWPDSLQTLEELRHLPFLDAATLAQADTRLLTLPQREIARVVTLETSGTQAKKRLYFSAADLAHTVDYFARGMETLVSAGDTLGICMPCDRPDGVGDLIARGVARRGVTPLRYGWITDFTDAKRLLAADALVGFPQQLLSLARRTAGQPARIRAVLLSADSAPEALKAGIRDVWHCEVYEHYGLTETGLGCAIDCDAHRGYHIRENDLYVEIIDEETGEVCPPGRLGEVVVSTLTRTAMPLLRYRTGDRARFVQEPCPCGTVLHTLDYLQGRINAPAEKYALDQTLFAMPGVLSYCIKENTLYVETIGEVELPAILYAARAVCPTLVSAEKTVLHRQRPAKRKYRI